MKMVAVDWPCSSNAGEVAGVLTRSGLHPEYDTRPLNAVRGRSFAKTTIYVPESESTRAREVLSDWYADKNRRIEGITSGMWGGLVPPVLIAVACGVIVGIVTGQVGVGLVVAFLAFFPIVAFWHKRRPYGQKD